MDIAEIRLSYRQHQALTALGGLGEARSFEVAHAVGMRHKPMLVAITGLLEKRLIARNFHRRTSVGPVAHYHLTAAGRQVLEYDPVGPPVPGARANYGKASDWLLTTLLMYHPHLLPARQLARQAGVSLSQAEADIATWTKAGYVEKINRPRGQYRLSKRGVIYAENHRTSLPLLQVEVLAAFWNNIEGQEVIIVRVQAPRSGVKAALRRLADLHLATFNRAERTYALTASGLELARDPRVRARRQYQKRHRQADAALGRHTCGPE